MPTPPLNSEFAGCLASQYIGSGTVNNLAGSSVGIFPPKSQALAWSDIRSQAVAAIQADQQSPSLTDDQRQQWYAIMNNASSHMVQTDSVGNDWSANVGVGEPCQPTDGPIKQVRDSDTLYSWIAQCGTAAGGQIPELGDRVIAQSQQAFGALFQNLSIACDIIGPFQEVNDSFVQLPGYTNGGNSGMSNAQFSSLSQQLSQVMNNQVNSMPAAGQMFVPNPGDAEITAAMLMLSQSIEYVDNPNFRVMYLATLDQADPESQFSDLALVGVTPAINNPGETDLEMLTRILPTKGWSQSPSEYNNRPYARYLPVGGSVVATVLYMPVAIGGTDTDSLANQFYHLWDYTPASGPPIRNGIKDFMLILSMLPIQF